MQKFLSYIDWIELVYSKNKEKMKDYFEFNIINKNEIIESRKYRRK